MSFVSKDTFDRSISKSREKERASTVSHAHSPTAFSIDNIEKELIRKRELMEQHPEMEIAKHPNDDEHEMPKVTRQETLEYCRDKLTIKPKKMPYDQKQQKISQGVTKQRSDYPTMEDICSDWESDDETEQMTKQLKGKVCRDQKKSSLQQHQAQKEQIQLQQQQSQNYHQIGQNNQETHQHHPIQYHHHLQEHQLVKETCLVQPKIEAVEKQQSKKKSNAYLKPSK
uniref:Uncharacterized protein n=1 Tax=Setaria digitata TaxID=48799 RepID=A0A915PFJ6_9BILA